MRYQTTFNYKRWPGERLMDDDITVPGQTYSVKEALQRVQSGLPVNTGRRYAYAEDGDEQVPFIMRDLTDIDMARQKLEEIRHEAKEKAKQAKQKEPPGKVYTDPEPST